MSTPEKKIVLVFPGGMPRSLEFLEKCQHEGQLVVGASSLEFDTAKSSYPVWDFLPFVTSAEFDDALKNVVFKHGVTHIFTPNLVVWNYLSNALQELAPSVSMENGSPAAKELAGYRAATKNAVELREAALPLASNWPAQPMAATVELAAFFRHVELIPGMCDRDKMMALAQIFRHSPPGDIVEIGSWWGKSALLLARLGRLYGVGKLLCVDPWTNEHLVQGDEKGLVDQTSLQLDADEALHVFEMNLLPYSAGDINYLRMPSIAGAEHYQSQRDVATASFGTTSYCGKIAILHIDGNHSYPAAKADIAAWSGLVVEGGWMVVDDYRWPYGDGPRTASDEFLQDHFGEFGAAFVMGGALFLQRSPEHPPAAS